MMWKVWLATFLMVVTIGGISAADLQRLGCWRDTSDRAIPTLEGQDPILDGDYKSRTDAIRKCQDAATSRGYTVFALQNGGWCASSSDALQTYQKYGPSTDCLPDGEGGGWSNEVYMIITHGDPCMQPMDPGPCDGYFPRWFFNSVTGECEEFIYGGCDGNDNRFLTWGECESICGASSESSEEGSGSSSSSSEGSLSLSGNSSSSNSSESSSSSSESMETRRDRCYIDIVLVLDDSSSITVFQHALSYMVNFTRCKLSNETVEIGVIVYNCIPRTEIPLGLYTAGDPGLEADIEYIMQQGGLSRTAPAIRYMKDTTPWRDGADRVAIVLTDGFPQGEPLDDHKAEANAARAEQIKMYSVGLGDPVDNKVLKDIATGASRVFDDTDPCDLYYRIVKRCGKKRRNGSGGVSSHGSSSSSDSDDSSDSSDYSDSSDSSDSSYMMG